MLEYFVHIDKDDPPGDLVLAVGKLPEDLTLRRIDVNHLPEDWRDPAAPPQLARFGDEFARKEEHGLLLVPSVVAPSENNCLINPDHPDFKRITVLDLEPLRYDPRMFGIQHRKHRRRSR